MHNNLLKILVKKHSLINLLKIFILFFLIDSCSYPEISRDELIYDNDFETNCIDFAQKLSSKPSHKPPLTDAFMKRAISKLKEHIERVSLAKASDALSSSSRSKKKMPVKLDDAIWAGTRKRAETALILTEGDSAKALAIAGLGTEGRKHYGVYPLKGKPMNVRGASASAVRNNKEIMDVMCAMGLTTGKPPVRKSLRYNSLLIMTDADDDGSHIAALIINIFDTFWPSVLKWENFIGLFVTPQRRAKRKRASETIDFYTDDAFSAWEASGVDTSQYTIKFYKGLGTWKNSDARSFFSNIDKHRKWFERSEVADAERLDLAFNKKSAKRRKTWLLEDSHREELLTVANYVDTSLKEFSKADNARSLPSVLDGLKVSQRKILFVCLKGKNGLDHDLRVSQLSGRVSEETLYHHGEASLQGAIVKLAQDFCGSNNLPYLKPEGQFGSRLENGADHASARYIQTRILKSTRALFPRHMDAVLRYNVEDGVQVEPETYFPCIPTMLVNGCLGIGTGWSSEVLPHSVPDVVAAVKCFLSGNPNPATLRPHWNKFKGSVDVQDGTVTCTGIAERDGTRLRDLRITELPPGVSVTKFVQAMHKLEKDVTKRGTIDDLDMLVHDGADLLARKGGVPLLSKKFYTTNMVAFAADSCLKKYDTAQDILNDYFAHGEVMYTKSLDNMRREAAEEVRRNSRRRDLISVIIENRMVAPFDQAVLQRHMDAKGWTEDIKDLVDSIGLRELTVAGVAKLQREVDRHTEKLERLNSLTWRELWSGDVSAFEKEVCET